MRMPCRQHTQRMRIEAERRHGGHVVAQVGAEGRGVQSDQASAVGPQLVAQVPPAMQPLQASQFVKAGSGVSAYVDTTLG